MLDVDLKFARGYKVDWWLPVVDLKSTIASRNKQGKLQSQVPNLEFVNEKDKADSRYPGVRCIRYNGSGPSVRNKDTVQLETAVNTISHEYLLEFTSEYGIPKTLHPALPGPEDRVVDFPEVPLLTLTANRVIEMDDPSTVSESSGVPPTIERSPLDFSLEAGASDQGTAASEILPFGEVPTAAAPEPSQVGVAAPDPPAATSSLGVVAAKDPESENASSPTEVGSPGARQVALGSQLRLRLEQEAKLLRKFVAQVARRHKRIEARELEIKNLEALLETEADMKRVTEDKSVGLIKESEDMRARFSDLQAAFIEFKRYEDERVERRCAELDARLDALSIDFDEELYPHMLTAIAGRMWVIGHGLRLAMMKCAESLEMRQAFADVVSARVAKEAEAKFVAALQLLKDLKYPLLDQLEGLKDAPMDVIMAALYRESDTGGMPHNIYATSAPASLSSPSPCTRRSDGVSVSVPTVVPQGLALLLVDAATQTDLEDA
nr:hypothetical protein [Tanacetum cinerariifolium]